MTRSTNSLSVWTSKGVVTVGILLLMGCLLLIPKGKRANEPFVPMNFDVPHGLDCSTFELRPLKVEDAEQDFAAVMESKLRLRKLFGPEWPPDDFTLLENQVDLAEHERAFQDRKAFTYTVVAKSNAQVLGCVYIFPSEKADAEILFWIRDSAVKQANGEDLDTVLHQHLQSWLKEKWPFQSVDFVH